VLNDQVLDLTDELLNSGGSLNDSGGIGNGNQGSANNRWQVGGNWCRNFVLNWSLNSGPLNFRGSRSLNGSRWSLDWNWNWSADKSWEHDFQHLSNPETGDLCSRCIEVDVTSRLENVRPNCSLGIQQ
jgi:hypothetical protein